MEHGAGGGRARFPAIFDAAFRFAERAPRPSAASVRPPASFQIARFKREDARTATALPLTRSLGRTFAWAPQAAARLLLCLARPPRPSNATRPPTFLPSFSPKRYPPLPPTSLPVEARKPQVCSMQCHRARRLSHLSGFPSSTAASVYPSHSFEAFFAPLLRAIEYVAPRYNPSLTQ